MIRAHDLLTVKQSAAYYGCSIGNIHKMIQSGKLDCFIDEDNTNIRYVLKSQVLEMRRKVRGARSDYLLVLASSGNVEV